MSSPGSKRQRVEGGGPSFGVQRFVGQEEADLGVKLNEKIDLDAVSFRPGAGQQMAYMETQRCIKECNAVFGFDGWSTAVRELVIDFADQEKKGRWSVGCHCVVRVSLKDGSHHEDVGYGLSCNQPSVQMALETAKKSAVSDAVKRSARLFGNSLGNSLRDKDHLSDLSKQKKQGRTSSHQPQPPQPHPQPPQPLPSQRPPSASSGRQPQALSVSASLARERAIGLQQTSAPAYGASARPSTVQSKPQQQQQQQQQPLSLAPGYPSSNQFRPSAQQHHHQQQPPPRYQQPNPVQLNHARDQPQHTGFVGN